MNLPAQTAPPSERDRLIDALIALIGERGWREFSLLDVMRAAQIDPAAGFSLARSKTALLAAWIERVDGAMLAEGAPGADEEPRARLFEVLMRRFDALSPARGAIRHLRRDLPRDPVASLAVGMRLARSMALALELAGIDSGGIFGRLRARTLVALEASLLGTFLDDDSADLARTMAALDAKLQRLEPWAKRLENMGFPPKSRPRAETSAQ